MVSRRPSTRWSGARCSDRSSRSTRHRDGAPVTAADIEAIRQLKARYFRTLDQKDWSGYRQVFADDVEIDVTDDAADGRYT
ncbi:MAG: nuclear transport factor 2 family protein, partial [Actinomycetota bacterium]|nr:nuclear transport factor 2 family protein [Actinomycetota bacterium]